MAKTIRGVLVRLNKGGQKETGWFGAVIQPDNSTRRRETEVWFHGTTLLRIKKGLHVEVRLEPSQKKDSQFFFQNEICFIRPLIESEKDAVSYLAGKDLLTTMGAIKIYKKYGADLITEIGKDAAVLYPYMQECEDDQSRYEAAVAIQEMVLNDNAEMFVKELIPEITTRFTKDLIRKYTPKKVYQKLKENPYNIVLDFMDAAASTKYNRLRIADGILSEHSEMSEEQKQIFREQMHTACAILDYINSNGNMYVNMTDPSSKSYTCIIGVNTTQDVVDDSPDHLHLMQTLGYLPVIDNAFYERNLYQNKKLHCEWKNGQLLVYSHASYLHETKCAENLAKLIQAAPAATDMTEIEERLNDYDRILQLTKHITLDRSQRNAVFRTISSRISILTGGAGTGKTTILKAAVELLANGCTNIENIIMLSPTNKAVKRMLDVVKDEAPSLSGSARKMLNNFEYVLTIHKFINMLNYYQDHDKLRIENTFFFVDETSMLDMEIAYELMHLIYNCAGICFCGDIQQLPSIGPGEFMYHICNTNRIPISVLAIQHRGNSQIIENAMRIVQGNPQLVSDNTMHLCIVRTDTELCDFIIRQYNYYIKDGYYYDSQNNKHKIQPKDICIITPVSKGPAGTDGLNAQLRELYNKLNTSANVPFERDGNYQLYTLEKCAGFAFGKNNKFRVGDRVICTAKLSIPIYKKTSDGKTVKGKTKTFVKGDTGIIAAFKMPVTEDEKPAFLFHPDNSLTDDEVYDIVDTDDNFKSFQLGYALTIHKAQGSEYPFVIVAMPDSCRYIIPVHPDFINRNMLYTAVTRGKTQVILAGTQEVIQYGIMHERIIRDSFLRNRIEECCQNPVCYARDTEQDEEDKS